MLKLFYVHYYVFWGVSFWAEKTPVLDLEFKFFSSPNIIDISSCETKTRLEDNPLDISNSYNHIQDSFPRKKRVPYYTLLSSYSRFWAPHLPSFLGCLLPKHSGSALGSNRRSLHRSLWFLRLGRWVWHLSWWSFFGCLGSLGFHG